VRPPRYSFVANVDLTDLQSEVGTRGRPSISASLDAGLLHLNLCQRVQE
jgi:hypothetical protein